MSDEPLRWFPFKVKSEEEIRVLVEYPYPNNTITELKSLDTVLNAILQTMRTGIYPGFPGFPGGGSGGEGSIITDRIAAVAVTAGQAIVVGPGSTVSPASNIPDQYELQVGVAAEDCAAGGLCKMVVSGEVSVPTWSYTPGQEVYVGLDGAIMETVPTTGTFWKLGRCIAPTIIMVSPETPVIL